MIYCTLFAKNYLEKGLVMVRSLQRYGRSRPLFILCMDDETYRVMDILARNLDYDFTPIRRRDIDTRELLEACRDRDLGERCWTYTPFLIKYVLDQDNALLRLEHEAVTYLDADTMFFSTPEPAEHELYGKQIAIVPHRFPERLKTTHLAAGKYNVNFVMFSRGCAASECLLEWQSACLEWCYRKPNKDGLLGDQVYWDKYTEKYPVHAIEHIGVGAGPWNMERWPVDKDTNGITRIGDIPLINFHFHGYTSPGTDKDLTGGYPVTEDQRRLIYDPYIKELDVSRREIEKLNG